MLIPQDIDYPGLELNIDREQASLLGSDARERGGQCHHRAHFRRHDRTQLLDRSEERQQLHAHGAVFQRKSRLHDHDGFPQYSAARRKELPRTRPLQSVARIEPINTPTEVDHYQIRRVVDVYVMPQERGSQRRQHRGQSSAEGLTLPKNARVRVQGAVVGMNQSFLRFGVGLLLAVVLVYLDP